MIIISSWGHYRSFGAGCKIVFAAESLAGGIVARVLSRYYFEIRKMANS
jgi:hypothetical protein